MNLYTTLKELCLCPSVSGRENAIREKLSALVSPFCDEVRVDELGNLIAHKKGSGNGKRIMLAAHMDEIGFIVNFVEDNGMLRIAPIGGISFVASAYLPVVSEKGVRGVLVPDEKVKPKDFKADEFYIDIGAKSKARALTQVSIGDFFVVAPRLEKLAGQKVCGRPLDDRAGCAALLLVAESLSACALEDDVYYVFTTQEEVGCRGARPAAFTIRPDVALCFDVTATGDAPGASPMACTLGGGAAIKIKDNSVICDEQVNARLLELAKQKGIKHQIEILLFGGTDTSAMQLAGAGARVGALSIPTRYIHSPSEVCDLADVRACADLAVEFIKNSDL